MYCKSKSLFFIRDVHDHREASKIFLRTTWREFAKSFTGLSLLMLISAFLPGFVVKRCEITWRFNCSFKGMVHKVYLSFFYVNRMLLRKELCSIFDQFCYWHLRLELLIFFVCCIQSKNFKMRGVELFKVIEVFLMCCRCLLPLHSSYTLLLCSVSVFLLVFNLFISDNKQRMCYTITWHLRFFLML